MTNIEFIAHHLNRDNLKIPVIKMDSVCSFSGLPIKEGVKNSDLIKPTFTDHSFLRFNSPFSSVSAALCIESVIPSAKGFNALRNYSYLVTANELRLLKREEIADILLNPPTGNFILCVTYSNKKHTSYKSTVNASNSRFIVTTDLVDVVVDATKLKHLFPLIQSWYTIVKGKEGTSTEPTYFTKQDILQGCQNLKKIREYGIERYYRENAEIEPFRNTAFLNLIVHVLNKSRK